MKLQKIKTATLPKKTQPMGKQGDINLTNEMKKAIRKLEDKVINEVSEKNEKINHPSHYQGNSYEVIDIIEDFELDFNQGNALKYLLRAGKKHYGCEGYCEDLEKAIWYLNRSIKTAHERERRS